MKNINQWFIEYLLTLLFTLLKHKVSNEITGLDKGKTSVLTKSTVQKESPTSKYKSYSKRLEGCKIDSFNDKKCLI